MAASYLFGGDGWDTICLLLGWLEFGCVSVQVSVAFGGLHFALGDYVDLSSVSKIYAGSTLARESTLASRIAAVCGCEALLSEPPKVVLN